MKILLHSCCAPCSLKPFALLGEAGHDVVPYFYNPNIHPYKEYERRRDTFLEYYKDVKYLIDDEYTMEEFLKNVAHDYTTRCKYCYDFRLERAARLAKEQGFDAFTTSLLISPYQKHDEIIASGKAMAEKYGIEFYYEDFRPYFREGQNIARELNLYRQPYCGCIYSEKDRYYKIKG